LKGSVKKGRGKTRVPNARDSGREGGVQGRPVPTDRTRMRLRMLLGFSNFQKKLETPDQGKKKTTRP